MHQHSPWYLARTRLRSVLHLAWRFRFPLSQLEHAVYMTLFHFLFAMLQVRLSRTTVRTTAGSTNVLLSIVSLAFFPPQPRLVFDDANAKVFNYVPKTLRNYIFS